MDCDIDGNWVNERVPCLHTCPKYQESDIGVTGVDLWFDAADECMVFSDNSCTTRAIPGTSKVGCIKDKSPKEYNATQSSTSRKPSYSSYEDGQNGLPVVNFNGIDNALRYPDLGPFSQTTGFLVHNIESFSGNEYDEILGADKYVDGNVWWFYAHDDGDYISHEIYSRSPGETYDGIDSIGNFMISTMLDDNTTAATYHNGSIQDSQVITWPQDKRWGPGTIGAWYDGLGLYEDYSNINLAEFIVYDNALTYQQRQEVESYLGDKWGIVNNDVYQSAKLWLDATDLNTVKRNATCTNAATAGSHTVGCWMDKSGNNYHATQPTSSFRPFYTSAANGHNNLPTIKFDGSNDRLAFPDLGEFWQTTVFAIHKEDSYPSGGQMIIGPSGWDNRDSFLYFEVAPGERMRFWIEGRDPTSLTIEDYTTAGTYNLTSAYDNDSKTELFRNGNSLVAANVLTYESMTWGPGHIGAWDNGGFSQFHTGNIGEILLYDQPLSQHELEVVHTYLIDKWNVKDADIKDSSILWLDGDDPSTLFTNTACSNAASIGNNIGCWKDKSGNNNNAIQGTGAKKPQYIANGMNSKPALDFDRMSYENLRIPNSAGDDFDLIGNFTVMTTMRFDNIGNYWGGILVRGSNYANPFEIGTYKVANSSFWRLYFDVGDNTWDNTEGVESTFGSITTGTDYVFTFRTSGPASNHRIYINGEIKGNNTATASPSNSGQPVYIGNWDGTSTDGVDGKIAEILFFPSALSNSSREEVETYLGDKWGITINH